MNVVTHQQSMQSGSALQQLRIIPDLMRRLICPIIWQNVSIHRISEAGPSNIALWVRIVDFFIVPFHPLLLSLLPLLSAVTSFFGTFGTEFGGLRGTVSAKVDTLKYCNCHLAEMYKIALTENSHMISIGNVQVIMIIFFSKCSVGIPLVVGILLEYYWYLTVQLDFSGLFWNKFLFWYKALRFNFCGFLLELNG